jgi:hypothetical protein
VSQYSTKPRKDLKTYKARFTTTPGHFIAWIAILLCALSSIQSLAWTRASGATPIQASVVAHTWLEPSDTYGFILAAIASAHSSISLSMYELTDPAIETALQHASDRGVHVHVLLNAAYFGTSHNASAYSALSGSSVQVHWALGGQIFHAKYLVVDGLRAYIGTGNFTPRYYGSTRDYWIEDSTAQDVSAISHTFNADFAGTANQQPLASHGLVWSPGSTTALENLITSAHHTLLVENQEMASPGIIAALIADVGRGVVVKVVMTKSSSWTTALDRLANAGIGVSTLSSSQTYIHAKVNCADCTHAGGTLFLGSENFSTSSLSRNRELGVITRTLASVRLVSRTATTDFATGEQWRVASTTPTSAAHPSGSGGLAMTSFTASVSPSQYVNLRIHSPKVGDSCNLSVVLPSGNSSRSSGLGKSSADGHGNVSWTWKIGSGTRAGTASATVTCSVGTLTRSFQIS